MFSALFQYQFLQNAMLAAILASVVCGVIGVIIVEKKLLMLSGGIAHTAYGGVGLGYLLGFEPIWGAFLFAAASAIGIGTIRRKGGGRSDVIISLFWSLGMALGILFIALTPGYPPDMNSYLFGNILTVTRFNLAIMVGMTVLVLGVIFLFFQQWKAYLFDEEFTTILGLPVVWMEYLLLLLVAMAIVVLLRVAGIIMVLALLTAPAATASLLAKRLWTRMLYAVGLGILACTMGLWISYEWNIASGASIVILSVLIYFAVFMVQKMIAFMKRRKRA